MIKIIIILSLLMFFSFFSFSQDIEDISSQKAFELLENPSTYLIDVRSAAEYIFVGHPEMAWNVPFLFWNEEEQKLIQNENFLQDLKARFKKDDVLIFICRSGGRSLKAAKLASENMFNNVFNLKHGFEGDKDAQGYRKVNGWKNSLLPYTYKLKEELVYKK